MSEPDFQDALVFTGGGTGGHYYPAIALAEEARVRWPERPVAFVGARRGIEARQLPQSPWPHVLLDVEGFLGRSPLRVLKSVLKLWRAHRFLVRVWKQARPAAVIGTGGYASAPALLAARSLKIPYYIHESNAAPGALVRHLAGGARRVWCGMEAVQRCLPGAACRVVGTPVRASFLRDFQPLETLRPPFRLLVLGGSGGARALNLALLELGQGLLETHPDWEILHQAGPTQMEALQGRPRHPRHTLVPFLEGMDGVMEGSSLLISRSGASTCAELIACGRPAILVPLPTSAGDHQRMNARAMAAEGRAEVVEEGEAFVLRLAESVGQLMADPAARKALSRPLGNAAVKLCIDDLAL
nr:UDP-N-acetylglucosamine--N-acetylmuramyl-(pentapeptide) pyrophosphoryl-undecaprenol N-acetylglucosamine transferase [uncultured Holophaga sp.]